MQDSGHTADGGHAGRVLDLGRRLAAWTDRRPALFCAFYVVASLGLHTLVLLGYYELIDYEEQEYGNPTVGLMDGLLGPYGSYILCVREGGAYLYGLWCYPFFQLLGPSMFSLKLAGVVLLALGTWPWVDLARRLSGAGAAWTMAILLLLPFPFMVRMTVGAFSVATHMGTIIFSGFCLWFLWRGFKDRSLNWRWASLGAGLATGAGCFWAFSFWPVALGMALSAVLLRVPRRAWLVTLPAVVPGLVMVWQVCLKPMGLGSASNISGSLQEWNWASRIVTVDTREVSAGGMLHELWRIVSDYLPRFAAFWQEGSRTVIDPARSSIYYVLLLAAAALMIYRLVVAGRSMGRQSRLLRALPLYLPIPIYVATYLISGLYPEEHATSDRMRYFLPIVPWTFLIIGQALWHAPRRRRRLLLASAAFTAVLLGLGIYSSCTVFVWQRFPSAYLAVKGHTLKATNVTSVTHEVFQQGLRHPSPRVREWMVDELGRDTGESSLDTELTRDKDWYKGHISRRLKLVSSPLRAHFWEGFGKGILLYYALRPDQQKSTAIQQQKARTITDRHHPILGRQGEANILAAVRGIARAFVEDPMLAMERDPGKSPVALAIVDLVETLFPGLRAKMPKKLLQAACEGMGMQAVKQLIQLDMPIPVPPSCGPLFVRGLAQGFASRLLVGSRQSLSEAALPPLLAATLGDLGVSRAQFLKWTRQELERRHRALSPPGR